MPIAEGYSYVREDNSFKCILSEAQKVKISGILNKDETPIE